VFWNRAAETAERDEIEARQLELLQPLVTRVAERVPHYRAAFGLHASSAISSLDSLRELPFTTKHDLRAGYPFGMLAVPRSDCIRIHGSSGTKGKPTVVAYTRA